MSVFFFSPHRHTVTTLWWSCSLTSWGRSVTQQYTQSCPPWLCCTPCMASHRTRETFCRSDEIHCPNRNMTSLCLCWGQLFICLLMVLNSRSVKFVSTFDKESFEIKADIFHHLIFFLSYFTVWIKNASLLCRLPVVSPWILLCCMRIFMSCSIESVCFDSEELKSATLKSR